MPGMSQMSKIDEAEFLVFLRANEERKWAERRKRAHPVFPRLADGLAVEAMQSAEAFRAAHELADLEQVIASVGSRTHLREVKARLAAREAVCSSHIEGEALHVTPRSMTGVLMSCRDLISEDGFLSALGAAERAVRSRSLGLGDPESPVSMVNDIGEVSALCCAASTEKLLRSSCGIRVTKNAHKRLMMTRPDVHPGRTRRKGHDAAVGSGRYVPPLGGPEINRMLTDLCEWVGARLEQLAGFENLHERYAYAVAVSGIAHLRFESIHPFLDGNGRCGRSFAEAVLAAGEPKQLRAPVGVSSAFSHHAFRSVYCAALNEHTDDPAGFVQWWAQQVATAACSAHKIVHNEDGAFDLW